jgi:hypothetical protein
VEHLPTALPRISPGKGDIVVKLLDVDPSNYHDAPTVSVGCNALPCNQVQLHNANSEQEGIRRMLELVSGEKLNRGVPIDTNPLFTTFYIS